MVAAYGASAKPSVPDAVAMLREELEGGAGAGESAGAVDVGGRVVIASYLLAPGFFHDQLAKAGADVVTEPLLPSPVLAEIALDRYDAAVAKAREAAAHAPLEKAAHAPARAPQEAPAEPAANAQQGGFFKAVRRFVTKYFPR
jgi:hypothetical protein